MPRLVVRWRGVFQPMHLLVIFGIAILVFGPKKLPELGKGIGDGIRGFKAALSRPQDVPVKIDTSEDKSSGGKHKS